MTTTNDKVRSVLLSALLVASVFAGTVAFAGTAAAANVSSSDADATLTDGNTYWQGQVLYSDAGNNIGADETLEIRANDTGNLATQVTADGDGEVLIDTSNLEGSYYLEDDGNTKIATFEIATQSFSADLESSEVTQGQSTDLTLSSNRGKYMAHVTSDSLTVSQLDDLFSAGTLVSTDDDATDNEALELDVQGDTTYSVSPSDSFEAGNYSFDVSVTDTTASASNDLNVTSAADEAATFHTDFVSTARGDTGTITVNLTSRTTATVNVGSTGSNYIASATLTDDDGDDQVSVDFNTFKSNTNNPFEQVEGTALSQTVYSSVSTPIDAGQYNTNVTFGDPGVDGTTEEAIGTLTVNERSTDGAQTWVAPSGSIAGSAAPSDITSVVSDADSTAFEDQVVVQVEATGLYGYISNSMLMGGNNDYGLSLQFTETNPGPNTDATTFDASADAVTIIPDAENNTFYAVVDTSADFTNDYSGDDAPAAGDNYKADFTVNRDANNNGNVVGNPLLAADSSESVNTTFDLTERTASFNEDLNTVPTGEANVSGTTSLAAGSELTVRARSPENNLLKTQKVTVQSGGSWTATFDFSDVDNSTEFGLTVENPSASADGIVDETLDTGEETTTTTTTTTEETTTTTTTEDTTTETTTTEMDTETETTTEETTTTESDGGIPGFGIGVALIAFVAAALLAVRRSN